MNTFLLKRIAAYQKYQITVDQLNEAQREKEQIEEQMEKRKKLQARHADAFVDELEGDNLYHAIMNSDPDGQRFLSLPLVMEVVDQYPFFLFEYSRILSKLCHENT